MPGPFYNDIKGTTAGTPGTGAFTPNAAASGFRAWSTVPAGWVGLVKFDDGSAWETQYSYWNGTTLSRSATAQFVASSTGSALTLTSAATAAMVADANEIGPDFCGYPVRGTLANPGATTTTALGMGAVSVSGTAAIANVAATNFLTRQTRSQITSLTTTGAAAGWTGQPVALSSSTAGVGGWSFNARFGASALPTNPRLYAGMTAGTFSTATETSSQIGHYALLAKDSTDTNLQIMTRNNTTTTKIDTGIPLVANGWYDLSLWSEPGSLTIYYLLIRLDTGAIFYGSTTTTVPLADQAFTPYVIGSLNNTNTGTAIVMHLGHMLTRAVQ